MEHYKRLLAYIRPYWWIVIVATIFSFCNFFSFFAAIGLMLTPIKRIETHQELLDKGGIYKTLYQSQFDKDAPAL